MQVKTTIASLTAALALTAAPAFADKPTSPPAHAGGKASAPGQLCKSQSHKKTNHGKGKSPFAACVVGAARAIQDTANAQQSGATPTAPGRLCKDQSRKKAATDAKSPFAACVTGAAKAQQAS
jgi:hypothetical protein